jgi:hypothetical protein
MTQVKKYPIFEKKDGHDWFESSHVLATDYQDAKEEFAKQVWIELANNKYSDDHLHFDDAIIEEMRDNNEDTSFYEGEGFYDFSTEDKELFLSIDDAMKGIDSFRHDVYTWTIDKDRV